MANEAWRRVDEYVAGLLAPHDLILDAALEASDEAGLPEIAVSPNQGKLLQVLARSVGARRVLEIGTLGGYSAIWLARALPDGGRLVTLEADAKHAEVARANLVRAGVDHRVDLREGPAIETLPRLVEEGAGPFELVFIDANKDQIPEYYEWALKLTRTGSLIVVDNVVRKGELANPSSNDPAVPACRQLCELLADDERVTATVLQTVGAKGHDGVVMAVVE